MNNRIRKTIITLALVISFLAVSFPFAIQKAKADEDCAIVVSANASSTDRSAAETLQEYLYELDQSYYEIITDDTNFCSH